MTIQEAIDFLKQNGYKYSKGSNKEWNSHHLYKRIKGSDCQCNERPPSISFNISEYVEADVLSVGIVGESSNGQWVNTQYYSCPIDFVKELKTIEYTLIKSWEVFN